MKRRTIVVLSLGLVLAGTIGAVSYWRSTATAQDVPKIILFWEENFEGRSLEVTGSAIDLPVIGDVFGNEFDWNDEVRSIIVVSGTWRLYQHGRCNTELDQTPLELLDVARKQRRAGWSTLVSATSKGPLELPSAAVGGFFHDISSIELVSEANLPDWAAPRWRFVR